MTTKNEYHQFDDNQLAVLAFLKNIKMYSPAGTDLQSGVVGRFRYDYLTF